MAMSAKIWWVYSSNVKLGVYVAAENADEACQLGGECLKRPPATCIARYVISSGNPPGTIARLLERT